METNQTTNEEVSQPVADNTPAVVEPVETPQSIGDKPDITPQSDRDEKGRFVPGNNANPDGRPVGAKALSTKVREALLKIGEGNSVSYEEALIKKILHKAIVEGNDNMIKLIWNYLDGMPVQSLQHGGGIVMTTLSVEEREKLENLLYGTKEPAVSEPVATSEPTEDVEPRSDGTGNQWHSGTEEVSV